MDLMMGPGSCTMGLHLAALHAGLVTRRFLATEGG